MRRLTFFAALLFLLAPAFASAASLELWPEQQSVKAGDLISVRVLVSSDKAFNAIDGTISFSPGLLSVVSISKFNSVVSLWVQDPTYSNQDGTISFSGGIPNPGYVGSERRVVTIEFRAKKAGTAAVSFASASVLANDGSGTNILTDTKQATFTIGEGSAAPAPTVLPAQPEVTEPVSPAPAAESGSQLLFPPAPPTPSFDLVAYIMETTVPLYYFLIYIAASILVLIGFISYYMLGFRIRVYRVKPSSKAAAKTSPKTPRLDEN